MKRLLLLMPLILLLSACEFFVPVDVSTELQPGYDIVLQDSEWVDAGCLITINEDTFAMNTSIVVDTSQIGETVVLYSYDNNDTAYYCRRVVKVIDGIAPTVSLNPGIDTVVMNEEHIDAGVTATDNVDTELLITVESNVDTTQAGMYTIMYTVVDEEGNGTTMTRIVTVIDPN